MWLRLRQGLLAMLVANAVRPVPGFRPGLLVFAPGWLVGELAPQLLALTAADTATHLTARRRDRAGLVLAGLNLLGLAFLTDQARRVRVTAEEALTEGIGAEYQDQLDVAPTPADLATPWRALLNPFRIRNPDVHVERDIAYGEAGRRNHLDVYTPAAWHAPGAQPPVSGAPVLIQVHGGGWTLGTKNDQGIPLMQHLAAKGWVCVAINYRLAPRDPMPAGVIDVKKAIAWVREHVAAYGGNPDYVALTGGSAGGHLVALAAVTPNHPELQPGFEDADTRVQVAVPHYGVYDFAGASGLKSARLMRDTFLAPKIVQRSFRDHPEAFEDLTPLLRVTPDDPDFFVIHGNRDSIVDVRQARQFVARLRETSTRTVVYAELPGAQHAFDVFPSIRSAHVVRAIDRYLQWHWNSWRAEQVGPAGERPA